MASPIVDRIRIIPRAKEFLDRATGSSGEVFFSKETNTLRVYSGRTANRGGFEVITDNSLRRNAAGQEIATVKYNTIINNTGEGNKYILNGEYKPALNFVVGYTYLFDQTDPTNVYYPNPTGGANNQHPLNFSADDLNGELGGGTSYLEGVIYILDGEAVSQADYFNGFQRADTRQVQITITTNTPTTLYYWCQNHLNMGNTITVGMPGTGDGGDSDSGASITVSPTQPTEATDGTLWFDSDDELLYVYLESSGTFVRPKPTGFFDLGISDGDSGQFLQTNGSGILTFVDPPTLEVGADLILGDVIADTIETSSLKNTGIGNAELETAARLTISTGDGVTITGGPLRLPSFSEEGRDGIIAANGDMIYNTTSNKIEAYQNGSWIELDTGSAT